jgi:hypothetical protein
MWTLIGLSGLIYHREHRPRLQNSLARSNTWGENSAWFGAGGIID